MGACLSTKQKSNASRTGRGKQRYNKEGQRLVVGCIPYRYKENHSGSGHISDKIEVLVISAQNKAGVWYFPKGGWETDERKMTRAVKREAWEEAGVEGDIKHILGTWIYPNKDNTTCEVHMFPFLVKKVHNQWPESNRERKWASVAEAQESVRHDWMKAALDKFAPLPTEQYNYDNNQTFQQRQYNYDNNQTFQEQYNYDNNQTFQEQYNYGNNQTFQQGLDNWW